MLLCLFDILAVRFVFLKLGWQLVLGLGTGEAQVGGRAQTFFVVLVSFVYATMGLRVGLMGP